MKRRRRNTILGILIFWYFGHFYYIIPLVAVDNGTFF